MRALLLLLLATPAWGFDGYVRFDFQRASEVRLGAFAPVSRTVAILPEIRASGRQSELNLGVTAELGAFYVSAWMGGGIRTLATVPYFGPGVSFAFEVPPVPVYIESWTEYRNFRTFGGTEDELFMQHLLLVTVRRNVSLGGQVEPTWTDPGGRETLYVGPRGNVGFRGGDAIGVFVGWDTGGEGVRGRVTALLRF